ncbi:SRPBCC family protein [Streptomyces xanthophaeus]
MVHGAAGRADGLRHGGHGHRARPAAGGDADRPLGVGAVGGHGPVRYTVAAYVPGTWVRFVFTGPRGFHGFHEFAVLPVGADRTLLRHTPATSTSGLPRITWPLVWRPLHDTGLEDSLDRAELARTGAVARPAR